MDDTIVDRLARIETKLDRAIEDNKDIKGRVDRLDSSLGKLMGIAAVVGAFVTSAIHWLLGRI